MVAVDEKGTYGRSRLSFADRADVDEFVDKLTKFEREEMTPEAWRSFRLVRGTYGQRQEGPIQMLRIKAPMGILSAAQLEAMADVGERYSRGYGHITTRQNIQFHYVALADVEAAMHRLAEAGLTTREACGNAVRNITSCPYAGVAGDEVFDVTPYADALTRHLLRHELSASLPRKFKIAFEGCAEDHAVSVINDIGFKARLMDERRGFRVTVGGGTSILCRSGQVLHDFLPADDILNLAEAIVSVFHEFGDYEHRQRNRMKFLIQEMGFEAWKAAVERSHAALNARGGTHLPFDPEAPGEDAAPTRRGSAPGIQAVADRVAASKLTGAGLHPVVNPVVQTQNADLLRWQRTNVRRQKQGGYSVAIATVILGDLTSEQFRVLADIARAYADGEVRVTPQQNVVLRWVEDAQIPELFRRLSAAGLGRADADTIADVTSCPGAETCRLAVTQSRGLGRLVGDFLRERPDLVAMVPGLDIKVSGCPNGCGQHHIAGIGFQGSVRRLGGEVIPQYFLLLGGGADGKNAQFGRLAAKIPVHRVPAAIERLLVLYRNQHHDAEAPRAFFQRVELSTVKRTLADLEQLLPEDATREDYIDLGESARYKMEILDGECSA
jgi:sulfite reductase (NADPH) hemoprotein beta-component